MQAARFGRLAATSVVGAMVLAGLWWATTGHSDAALLSVRAALSETPPTSSSVPAPPPAPPSTTVAPSTPPPSSPEATEVCEARLVEMAGRDNPLHMTLVAAYASTAADVGADEERRKGGGYRSSWRDRPAGEFEAVCFLDADAFGASPRQVQRGEPGQFYDRLEIIIRPDGVQSVHVAGHKATLRPEPIPPSAPR